jgi:uncharacterized membrane protein YdbT with pleckstrin-like domain
LPDINDFLVAANEPIRLTEETTIWQGRTSHLSQIWLYALCLLIIPIPWAIMAWYRIVSQLFTITNQRIQVRTGWVRRKMKEVELYRVRETVLFDPLWQRIFGLGTIIIKTGDDVTPEIVIPAIKNAGVIRDQLRSAVEARRDLKRVRTLDIE